jgi:hypoxanthine phosphoribosyltransferase
MGIHNIPWGIMEPFDGGITSTYVETPPTPRSEPLSGPPTTSSVMAALDTSETSPTSQLSPPPSTDIPVPSAGSDSATPSTLLSSATHVTLGQGISFGSVDVIAQPRPQGLLAQVTEAYKKALDNVFMLPAEAFADAGPVSQSYVLKTPEEVKEFYSGISSFKSSFLKEPEREKCPQFLEIVTPSHTEDCFYPNRFKSLIDLLVKNLEAYKGQYQAIAACGNSGMTVASAISYVTGVPIIAVRKESDRGNHHGKDVTGYLGSGNYILLDDLVASGDTVRFVVREIEKAALNRDARRYLPPKCAAILLYRSPYRMYDEEKRTTVEQLSFKVGGVEIPMKYIGPPGRG